tara:strand:+ start:4796 stop:5554 length:759 start_codon:yes stop_codon:yes gene_type:complete
MQKRGQTTTFVILGIIIVIVALLLLYLRGNLFFGPVTPDTLGDRLLPISDHIKGCIKEVGDEPIRRIGLQGGHLALAEDTFKLYGGTGISYLCYNRKDDARCYTRMLTRGDMEEELSKALATEMNKCLNVNKFKKGFDLTIGQMSLATDIGNDNVAVLVTLPLTLKKGDVVIKEDSFSQTFNYPLGRLYKVSQDITDIESETGEFEQLTYMLAHKGQYIIDKKKPYPDKLYILQTKDSDYKFQFFVQGEPTA